MNKDQRSLTNASKLASMLSRRYGLPILAMIWALCPAVTFAEDDVILPSGAYRLEMIMASTTRVPFFGTSKSASKSISLVDIRREGGVLVQSHKVCDFRVLEDSAMIKMVFSEKFIAALSNHAYPIQLEKDGQGWRYRADLGLERIGYRTGLAMTSCQHVSMIPPSTIGTATATPARR